MAKPAGREEEYAVGNVVQNPGTQQQQMNMGAMAQGGPSPAGYIRGKAGAMIPIATTNDSELQCYFDGCQLLGNALCHWDNSWCRSQA